MAVSRDTAPNRTTSVSARRVIVGLCNCGRPNAPRPSKCQCVGVRDTPIDTPDLAIYSQSEHIANGSSPTTGDRSVCARKRP